MKLWITACDAQRRVTLNETVEFDSVRDASEWARSKVPMSQHGSICITDENNKDVFDDFAVASYGGGKCVGVTVNGKFVLSLPSSLNGGRIPELNEAKQIVYGFSVRLACACFKRDTPRVNLDKPAMPDPVPSAVLLPVESNAVLMARMHALVAERRRASSPLFDLMQERRKATVPAAADDCNCHQCAVPDETEPGDPCPACNACMHPGQDMCDDCAQEVPEMTNHYRCPRCAHEWSDVWTAACDDDCPECGARHITPYDTEEVAQ